MVQRLFDVALSHRGYYICLNLYRNHRLMLTFMAIVHSIISLIFGFISGRMVESIDRIPDLQTLPATVTETAKIIFHIGQIAFYLLAGVTLLVVILN